MWISVCVCPYVWYVAVFYVKCPEKKTKSQKVSFGSRNWSFIRFLSYASAPQICMHWSSLNEYGGLEQTTFEYFSNWLENDEKGISFCVQILSAVVFLSFLLSSLKCMCTCYGPFLLWGWFIVHIWFFSSFSLILYILLWSTIFIWVHWNTILWNPREKWNLYHKMCLFVVLISSSFVFVVDFVILRILAHFDAFGS